MYYFKKYIALIILFISTHSFAQQNNLHEILDATQLLDKMSNLSTIVFSMVIVIFFMKLIISQIPKSKEQDAKNTNEEEKDSANVLKPVETLYQQLEKAYNAKSKYLSKNKTIDIEYKKLLTSMSDIDEHNLLKKDSSSYKNHINLIENIVKSLNIINNRIAKTVEEDLLHSFQKTNSYNEKFLQELDEQLIKDIKISTKHNQSISASK